MARKDRIAFGLALAAGVLLGWVDIKSSEVMFPMMGLLLFSFALGIYQPRAAWRWGVMIGLSLPVAYGVASLLQIPAADGPTQPITLAVLVIPALAAAYAGVLVNHIMKTPNPVA